MSGREPPARRSAFRVFEAIETRWADNDIYGHINNVTYYAYFDTAVNRWLVKAGLLDIAGGDPIGLVVETGCRYHAPAAFPDTLEAGIRVSKLGNSSVRYEIAIFHAGGEEAIAEGFFTHVYVDRKTRRPKSLPEPWRRALAGLAS